ncbi:50S ribosomal protein L6 [Jimgerdemannia flammicorona]|uniref:50S ribosomal protein L6 n=1 Tax=Jimgerdemannia flammicorona TaxID=994334 RepID=A0A433D7B9_9FUNG|nr:50S ribosomal protein L6 [Jimgerdemannia flammicorona]
MASALRSLALPTRRALRPFSTVAPVLSHIGRKVIIYPSEVEITHDLTPIKEPRIPSELDNTTLTIRGPLGVETLPIKPFVRLKINRDPDSGTGQLRVSIADREIKEQRAMWGTTQALVQNYVTGVSEGFRVPLRLEGVGYRATLEPSGEKLGLKLGYANPVELVVPEGIKATTPTPTKILLQGTDLQRVKLFAAKIRKYRKPEPYNQKGIFVGNETIKKKEGKKK